MEEEQSKYKTARVLKFYKNYSVKDRMAVLKVFVEFLNDNKGEELGKPKRIIEEFYACSELSYDDLYEAYYRKIENIKGRKVKGIDDPELFELIRQFVFKYAPEKVWKLSPLLDVQALGDAIDYFIAEDRDTLIGNSEVRKNELPKFDIGYKRYLSLLTVKDKKTYRVEFRKHDNSDNDMIGIEENLRRAYPNKVEIYLALFSAPNPYRHLAFLYSSDSVINFYYGVNAIRSNFIFLKNWQHGDPLMLQYQQDEWDREENDNNNYLLGSSKPLMATGVVELSGSQTVDPDFMNDYWQYSKSLQQTEGRQQVESLHIADLLFDKLLKERNL